MSLKKILPVNFRFSAVTTLAILFATGNLATAPSLSEFRNIWTEGNLSKWEWKLTSEQKVELIKRMNASGGIPFPDSTGDLKRIPMRLDLIDASFLYLSQSRPGDVQSFYPLP